MPITTQSQLVNVARAKTNRNIKIKVWKMKILFIFAVSISFGFANAQLVGKLRTNFIEGTNAACFKSQRAGSVNATVTDAMLRSYCNCASIYIADLLNNQLAIDIENGLQKTNPAWGQLAQKYCQINYAKY